MLQVHIVKISLEGENETLFLQFEDLVKKAYAWTPFPKETNCAALGRSQNSILLISVLGDPDASYHWTRLWATALVDAAYYSRLALARIRAYTKLILGAQRNLWLIIPTSFKAKLLERNQSV